MVDEYPPITPGRFVVYFDEDKQPYVAVVAWVHDKLSRQIDRPICNLATFGHDGYHGKKVNVEPAYHNGERWIIINKWAWPNEVLLPKEDIIYKGWNPPDSINYTHPESTTC